MPGFLPWPCPWGVGATCVWRTGHPRNPAQPWGRAAGRRRWWAELQLGPSAGSPAGHVQYQTGKVQNPTINVYRTFIYIYIYFSFKYFQILTDIQCGLPTTAMASTASSPRPRSRGGTPSPRCPQDRTPASSRFPVRTCRGGGFTACSVFLGGAWSPAVGLRL